MIVETAIAAVAAGQAKYRHRTTAAAYKIQEIGVINVDDVACHGTHLLLCVYLQVMEHHLSMCFRLKSPHLPLSS